MLLFTVYKMPSHHDCAVLLPSPSISAPIASYKVYFGDI